ncbi:MAG: Hpt domain-containing protein [Magnetococcus sp. WYHC-3]
MSVQSEWPEDPVGLLESAMAALERDWPQILTHPAIGQLRRATEVLQARGRGELWDPDGLHWAPDAEELEDMRARVRVTVDQDLELAEEVLTLYFQDTLTRLTEIARLLEENRLDQVRELAHGLKGASSAFGGQTSLALMCTDLEMAALGGRDRRATMLYHALRHRAERLDALRVATTRPPS